MNDFAMYLGYAVMCVTGFLFTLWCLTYGTAWLINVSPWKKKVLYMLNLGMKEYGKMDKKDRKY